MSAAGVLVLVGMTAQVASKDPMSQLLLVDLWQVQSSS